MILKLIKTGIATSAKASPLSALWTFPSILLSAFVIAWGAEAAQFLISQGLALAILAWLQTLPEFAVEAVIAWNAGKDPSQTHLAIANFTGSLRLLVGLGWPMIYFVAAAFGWKQTRGFVKLQLEDEHSVEIFGLLLPILYFFFIWWKGTLSLWDAFPLSFFYFAYLFVLWKIPPREEEEEALEDLDYIPRKILSLSPRARNFSIAGLFLIGGAILFFAAHPFLESMLAIATSMGVPTFVFVQWVAPFLSEFPEKLSAFNWARRITAAPIALMNMVSSNINQWSILSAMIPVLFVISAGEIKPLVFDEFQRHEILLTILQSLLGFLLLLNLELVMYEALILFVFWLVQFCVPSIRVEMMWVYAGWCAFEGVRLLAARQAPAAWTGLRRTLDRRFA
ncbi:MAG: sodium:calcium antiporter [Acidobacteria bacterium]|nr:sodium:calcium antiporter [Acidobacteriota bacterium]MBV9477577.1 sodium:calcium antiporter [Acidobacteriota bacterium]